MNIAMILMTNKTLLSTTCSLVDQHERLHCINNPKTGKEGGGGFVLKRYFRMLKALWHTKSMRKNSNKINALTCDDGEL